MKDNNYNFLPLFSLEIICPKKSDFGSISKSLIDRIIYILWEKVMLPLWICTGDVIGWFENIDFYDSISPILLYNTLIFSRKYIDTSTLEIPIILGAKQNFIEYGDNFWQRADTLDLFDITMASSVSAQITDLV